MSGNSCFTVTARNIFKRQPRFRYRVRTKQIFYNAFIFLRYRSSLTPSAESVPFLKSAKKIQRSFVQLLINFSLGFCSRGVTTFIFFFNLNFTSSIESRNIYIHLDTATSCKDWMVKTKPFDQYTSSTQFILWKNRLFCFYRPSRHWICRSLSTNGSSKCSHRTRANVKLTTVTVQRCTATQHFILYAFYVRLRQL